MTEAFMSCVDASKRAEDLKLFSTHFIPNVVNNENTMRLKLYISEIYVKI